MNTKTHDGFTLLEIMIAMFVLSIGVLGSTSMVIQAQRATQQVDYRGKAVQYAYGMAERMRANFDGVNQGAYDAMTAGQADPGCINVGCTGPQMAQYDSFEWGQQLVDNLPQGAGSVSGAGVDTVFTITINWIEKRRNVTDPNERVGFNEYSLSFQP